MTMSSVALATLAWSEIHCFHCHAPFAVPVQASRRLRESHKNFYCPFCGGAQCYPDKNKTEQLRDENAKLRERLQWKDNVITQANARAATAEQRRRSTRAVVTKLKKRAAAGKCPCCSEKFPDLKAHIEARHPGYGDG